MESLKENENENPLKVLKVKTQRVNLVGVTCPNCGDVHVLFDVNHRRGLLGAAPCVLWQAGIGRLRCCCGHCMDVEF